MKSIQFKPRQVKQAEVLSLRPAELKLPFKVNTKATAILLKLITDSTLATVAQTQVVATILRAAYAEQTGVALSVYGTFNIKKTHSGLVNVTSLLTSKSVNIKL